MVYLITAAVLIFGYVAAQDADCDFRQNVVANEVYSINKNYGPGRTCRYIANCPAGYNCRADCNLSMPLSTGCSADRFLISKSGDPFLTGAKAYCGRRTISAVSTGTSISLGLIASSSSRGGSYACNLSAQRAPVTPAPTLCRCGERKQTRIVGGQETKVNEYTMMAGIIENSIESIHCGAVIISSRYVMTAAHCVNPYRLNPAALTVTVGDHNIEDSNTGTRYSIARFIIHENFNPDTYDYDIALIVLTRDIPFTETVQPVCLPFKYENTDLTGKSVTIIGWGTTSFGGPTSDVLRKVDVNVIDQNTCRASEGNNIGNRQICTNTPGKDACQFDSGGPVMYADPSTGLLFSVGIVSYGNRCASGQPATHTRVTALLQWIVNNANSQFCIKR